MLKKLFCILVFISLAFIYLYSNSLFFLEEAIIVKGGKSSGSFTSEINCPYIEKDGVYKSFDKSYNYSNLLKSYGAKLLFIESCNGVTNYYYYSKKISSKEVFKNKKVNIQVAVTSDNIVIGSPIIYGGY